VRNLFSAVTNGGVPSLSKYVFSLLEGGDLSGASQPRKHLQFFPTENEDGPPIERLARAARIDKDGRCPPVNPASYKKEI
jgi:ATP adenylyltransferase